MGRSSRILHHHDRLARSPNLSRFCSSRAYRPLCTSGNAGIRGIDRKGRPIRESAPLSRSLRGLPWSTRQFSGLLFRVFRSQPIMRYVLPVKIRPRELGGARQLVRNHEQTGTLAPSENARLPPVLAHQLASAQDFWGNRLRGL